MSIGLIDQDCLSNKKDFFYDLDIMKLASYYKRKREITKLLLDPREYTQYTRTYFIKNRFDYKMMGELFKDPRITYRGYAFSALDYEPLPDDIERAQADISIYDTYLKFNDNLADRRVIQILSPMMENSCHARLSTDNKTCNVPTERVLYKDSTGLCLYDYNIFALEDWYYATQDYREKSLRFRFSPITSDLEDIKKVLNEYNLRSENHLILSGTLNDDMIQEIISLGVKDRIRVQLLQDLNPYDDEDMMNKIIYAMNTILVLKQAHLRIHAYIDPHDIDQRTAYLNNLAYWMNRNHSDTSFSHFVHNIRKQGITKFDKLAESNEIFKCLYNMNPSEWKKIT